MSELDENVKTFISCALACWDSPTVVAAAVKEQFGGLVVSRQQVQAYDPTTRQGSRLSEGHTQLFFETRKRFLALGTFTTRPVSGAPRPARSLAS
jgi:hypothetical protein